jgi:hypothetical protein
VNGKAVTLYFRIERNSSPKLFRLPYGSWQGTELVLEDRGTLAYFFNTSSDKKSQPKPPDNGHHAALGGKERVRTPLPVGYLTLRLNRYCDKLFAPAHYAGKTPLTAVR